MGKHNVLNWETASEVNTAEFAIERSPDGRNNWEVIGKEEAAGESNASIMYSFIDRQPATQGYYRLKTTDFDAYTQVSDVISIKRKVSGLGLALITPNPTAAIAQVSFESSTENTVSAVIRDVTGRAVQQVTMPTVVGSNQLTVDLSPMPAGVYFMTLNNGTETVTKRLVKN